jgi:hypothetical protein
MIVAPPEPTLHWPHHSRNKPTWRSDLEESRVQGRGVPLRCRVFRQIDGSADEHGKMGIFAGGGLLRSTLRRQ